MKPLIALAESRSHHDGVVKALRLIEAQIEEGIKGKRRVLVKPNFVSTSRQLAASHVDAVRAVLDVIGKYHSGRIVIGEGPSFSSLRTGLVNFDYLKLQREYDVDFVDLNEDDYVEVEGFDSRLKPLNFRMSKSVINSDYRVSVALPKTHDSVVVTLSIKNMVVGSLINREKPKIHQGYKAMNLNLAKLSLTVMPHLGVIDGFQGMEGRGPVTGDPVDLRVAAASTYPVSLDAVFSKIMGFDPLTIGYLYHLNEWKAGAIDLSMVDTIGMPLEDAARQFKPHPRYHEMLKWK